MREREEREMGGKNQKGTTFCVHYTSWEDQERERERPGEREMRQFLAFRQSWCTAMKGEKGYQAVFKAIFRVDTRNALGVRVPLGAPWCARSSARSKGSAGEE